jgi:ESS family glutamate:Na+ symporter
MTLDFTQTLAFAGLVLFLGYGIKRAVPLLHPLQPAGAGDRRAAGVVLITAIRRPDWSPITFDTALQPPLMNRLLHDQSASPRACRCCAPGGPQVLRFFLLSVR